MDRLLLLRPDQAGDALKTLPALRALRRYSPDSEIHLVASPANASLLEAEPGVCVHRIGSGWRRASSDELAAWVKSAFGERLFDTAISLPLDPSDGVETLLSLVPARRLVSAVVQSSRIEKVPLVRGPAGIDESISILDFLSRALSLDLGRDVGERARQPVLCGEDLDEARAVLGEKRERWLGVCPLASLARRTLPARRWRRWMATVLDEGHFERIFLFGSPDQAPVLRSLVDGLDGAERVRAVHASSVRALGAFLRRTDAVVAVDSGPLHLALALGVPVLGFLSGGDSARWFPRHAPTDLLVRRGVFDCFPSVWEMRHHYRRWMAARNSARCAASPVEA